MPRIAFYTLGCKVNQYETEALKELFLSASYEVSEFDSMCDVYVINSCTVTATGDKKSRQAVSKARRKNPNSIIALIGCYAQHLTEKEQLETEADIILGNGNKNSLLKLIEEKQSVKEAIDVYTFDCFDETPISGSADKRARGYIKIQDGCNRFCSYCIIPYVRGKVRSRSLEGILKEAKTLSENGQKELVLTGIQVGAYGDDKKDGTSLIDAIETAAKPSSVKRIRLSSIEPVAITEEFLERCKKIPSFCPHFHLSLQSGCDKILNSMNRRYTTDEYFEKVQLIRKIFPDAGITTDVISGFPGETEEDFETTLRFTEKCGFSKIHAFPYSPREGTKAAKLTGLPLKSIRNNRAKKLISLSERLSKEFIKSQAGKKRTVYIERIEGGTAYGYTDNYIYVSIPCENLKIGDVKEITFAEAHVSENETEA